MLGHQLRQPFVAKGDMLPFIGHIVADELGRQAVTGLGVGGHLHVAVGEGVRFVAHGKETVLGGGVILAAPGKNAGILGHVGIVMSMVGEPLDTQFTVPGLVVAVAGAVVGEGPRHAGGEVNDKRNGFGSQHFLAVTLEITKALRRMIDGLYSLAGVAIDKAEATIAAGVAGAFKWRAACGRRRSFLPIFAAGDAAGSRQQVGDVGLPLAGRVVCQGIFSPTELRFFVEQNVFERVQGRGVGIGEGLLAVPAIGGDQGRFDHAKEAGQQVRFSRRVDRFGHQVFERVVAGRTEGRRLDLTQTLIEVLYMLGIFPKQAPHGQFPVHIGGGGHPGGQNAQGLVFDKAVAVEQCLVVSEIDLFRRGKYLHYPPPNWISRSAAAFPKKISSIWRSLSFRRWQARRMLRNDSSPIRTGCKAICFSPRSISSA